MFVCRAVCAYRYGDGLCVSDRVLDYDAGLLFAVSDLGSQPDTDGWPWLSGVRLGMVCGATKLGLVIGMSLAVTAGDPLGAMEANVVLCTSCVDYVLFVSHSLCVFWQGQHPYLITHAGTTIN